MVWDRQCLEDSEWKDDSINEWITHEGISRTDLATPGLLNIAVTRNYVNGAILLVNITQKNCNYV